ncbi:cytochrome P450 [Annulohypoxylon truncatum]|uniref:cytochrome P450 n=1 Tax=Annulohypoxylon truncatum TaxID=327061 RepID=UPI0020076764|nr:cytochrome P450 [Annulohypoxylon truncatum]KAI1205731.1 cytochrome P450 [Annulohypoxylon truncatum]
MDLTYLILVAAIVGGQLIYTGVRFLRYRQAAQRSGLPYTWSLVHELQGPAFITDAILRWWYRDYLEQGKGWPRWARFMIKDWHYEDRRRATLEYGDCFLVVTPNGLICYISEPNTASRLVTRRKAFIKPADKMEILEPFGPNVVSVEGDLWKFHLAITLPPLAADSVARLVWDETARQVDMMVAAWKPEESNSERIYALTMNIMSLVGFGRQAEWGEGKSPGSVPAGHKFSLVSALTEVIMHLPHILLLPRWLLRWTPWPIAYHAANEVESYIDEFLGEEREKLQRNSSESSRENLLTAVVRSNLAAAKKVDASVGRSILTDEEIRGNVFIFLVAGYDTTANTVQFSSLVLAFHQDVQERVLQEIDAVYAQAKKEGRSELSYENDFPRFRYLVAFMYEVMRVFPIVQTLARVAVGEQGVPMDKGSAIVPAGTRLVVNNTAIHYDPAIWPSPDVIEPRRWLVQDPHLLDPAKPLTATQEAEIREGSVAIPSNRKGTFLSFGEGPRACLGRSFARVEFVSLIARLLRHHRLELADKDPAAAARHLRTARLRSGGSPVTLIPPEDVPIRLVPRGNV